MYTAAECQLMLHSGLQFVLCFKVTVHKLQSTKSQWHCHTRDVSCTHTPCPELELYHYAIFCI